jgi:hypothetical protein
MSVLYTTTLLDIEQVEILRKVKMVAEKVSKSLVSDGRVCTYSISEIY